jgi:SAM-dependent methyltransferase
MNRRNQATYTGVDNLEVMSGAVNYNGWLVDLVVQGMNPQAELVDYGAGSGTIAALVAERGFGVRCIEPDADLAGRLADAGFPVSPTIECMQDVPFIYTLNVLEHIEDDAGAVEQLYRHMSPGGAVFAYVPAFMVLYSKMDRKVGHFRRYRRKQLADLFERAGFVLDEVRYADSLGFLVAMLYKWIGNRDGDLNSRAVRIYDRLVFPLSRILDKVFSPWFGKNVMVRAHKPET